MSLHFQLVKDAGSFRKVGLLQNWRQPVYESSFVVNGNLGGQSICYADPMNENFWFYLLLGVPLIRLKGLDNEQRWSSSIAKWTLGYEHKSSM